VSADDGDNGAVAVAEDADDDFLDFPPVRHRPAWVIFDVQRDHPYIWIDWKSEECARRAYVDLLQPYPSTSYWRSRLIVKRVILPTSVFKPSTEKPKKRAKHNYGPRIPGSSGSLRTR